jgi:hypothetical protein
MLEVDDGFALAWRLPRARTGLEQGRVAIVSRH